MLRIFLCLCLSLTLAACSGSRRVVLPPSDAVVAPDFGDADPADFPGRGPAGFAVHGIDASKFQGRVDWAAARNAGVNFAFLKATEGGDRVDDQFTEHWHGAGSAGIARGAYHFFYFCTPAAVQAKWFIRNVPRTKGALPPVLDLEWNPFSPTCTTRPPPEVVRREARIFIDIVARHYGQRPIIYTTPEFFDRNGIGQLGEELWLRAVADLPGNVYPGVRWSFWQYSGTGLARGFPGKVDLNVFSGSAADWRGWLARRAQ
ncbi:GH25 family lysozyme [Oceaniovalibus sp. ACAM 378]|uniref:glycoside hydrolase family 25 protein n=1 Tax=Oceaniovalibus sp. ACAM 378 TaxID=2599923 RepID=UPI0011D86527|nr:GH25 family lysozyme [Oceaniovalibus sp. ACAM 378]TYB90799.1 glycoside hydrolase family 25 protein [Oceaniovalibus sp. ACAM 378]